jgi:hypothetical protein
MPPSGKSLYGWCAGRLHRREDEYFVNRKVELDARRVTGPTEWTAIPETPLCRLATARIGEYFELARFRWKLQAAGVVDPFADFLEDVGKKGFVKMIGILQCEIEVFGKAIGFEIAFLEAGSALEDPSISDRRMGGDAGEQPAQRVILLDDMGLQLKFGGERHDLLLRDHGLASRSSLAGTQTRQAVISRSAGSAGSSLA